MDVQYDQTFRIEVFAFTEFCKQAKKTEGCKCLTVRT